MRTSFFVFLGCLLALSGLVWIVQPATTKPGKTTIVRLSDNNNLRVAQVDLFNKLHPKLDMQLDASGSPREQVIVQSLGGVGPDLFDCFSPFDLSAFVQSGIAWDITDELKRMGIDIQRDCFPGMLPTAMLEGRVYGVPTNIAADGIWFHRNIFKQYNIPIHRGPWKWAEFVPIAQKLTVRDRAGKVQRYGFYFDWWNWAHFFKGFGARVYNANGTRCTVDSPEGIAAVQFMYDLVYKYKVSATPVEEAAAATQGGFGNGTMAIFGGKRAATALGGRWWLALLRTYKDIDIGVMESPYATTRTFHAYARATLINKESLHKAESLQYLLYQTGPEYNDLVNDQADGITAFPKYAQGRRFEFNPAYPKETDNAIWRQITELAAPDETSPFINGQVVNKVMTDQLDLVRSGQKTPASAMHDAAKQINESLQKALPDDPDLAERYRKAVGQ